MSSETISLPTAISDLYPFQQNRIRLSCGYEMSYVDKGEGHPVLMIHGNPTWSFFYRELIKTLRPGFRCIAPDHIGCGLSDKPKGAYCFKLDQRIRDLEDFVDGLGLERFDLVVHDWGGAIGIGMALSRLKSLRRLAVLNTAAFVDSRIPRRISLCRAPLLGKLIVQGFNGFALSATRMAVSCKPLDDATRDAYLYPYNSWTNRRAVYEFVKDIPMHVSHPSFDRLLEIENGLLQLREKPVALFWGGKDFCFTNHFMDRWKRFLPQATAVHYAEAGHYILDDESEKVCSAIEKFLSYDADGISGNKLV